MIRVAIVDDQALVRQGIASLLSLHQGISLEWQACCGDEAIQKLSEQPVDVLLMDIRMPGKNGVDTLCYLREQDDTTKVIMLTTFDDPELFNQAMHAGANGFLLKDVDTEKLHNAIEIIFKGGSLAEPVLLNQLSEEQLSTFADANIEELSIREIEILKLIAGGYSNREIAVTIFLAEGTIKNHVSNILTKTKH